MRFTANKMIRPKVSGTRSMMFTWWGLYKSVPYELALKELGEDRTSSCAELPAECESAKRSAGESAQRGIQGEVNGS